MCHHQRSAGLEPTDDLRHCILAFGSLQEMERQEAGGGVERPRGRIVCIAMVKRDPLVEVAQSYPRFIQHGLCWINTDKGPGRILRGKGFNLQSTACSMHQHMSIRRRMLSNQNTGHTVHGIKTRHEFRRAVSILGGVLRIFEYLYKGS